MDIWRDIDFNFLFSIIMYSSYFDYLMFVVLLVLFDVIVAVACYSPQI